MSKIIVRDVTGEHSYSIQDSATVGRHPSSVICLHDPMVSKHHARIQHIGEHYIYEDLASSNGSFLNGIRVSRHPFSDGDVITLGKVDLIFHALSEDEKLASMVDISRISESSEVQDRIQVVGLEQFQAESEVADLSVLREDYEKLRLGSELMHTLGAHRELSVVLESAADELLRIFHADRCMIMLYQKEHDELVPKVVRTRVNSDDQLVVSGSILAEVQQSKLAVLLSDASQDSRFAQASSLIMQGIKSVMCAPIIDGEEFLGVVHLDSQKHGLSGFTRKDLQLLTGIVQYIAMAIANAHLLHKVEQEARFKAQFERLLSPSVVEQVMSGAVNLEKGGELRDVTILFADIRDFTRLSHNSEATRIVAMLNRYFEMVVDIVFKHGGTVDKFIGDEIMVLFGAPLAMEDAADRAVSCALEMQGSLEQFNLDQKKYEEDSVHIGVGVNSGEVVVGSIGSTRTMQYTCIGDAVNVASRLTSHAKVGEVIISNVTKKRLKRSFEYEVLPPFSMKGIDGTTGAWFVKDLLDDTNP
ncbi:GAF domain-containing protein [Mariprofundus ferrooxydans]|nr:GAF domain-containing protein [Mariprofundus ferrooxydans]